MKKKQLDGGVNVLGRLTRPELRGANGTDNFT